MSISSGKQFVGLLYPLDTGTAVPTGIWSSIPLPPIKRLLALLPSDQLRREETAAMFEAEGGKKISPDIMELTINLSPTAAEFALNFNQFTWDEIKLSLPVKFESGEVALTRASKRPKVGRITTKKQPLPEPSHKLDTVKVGGQRDVAKS